MKNIYVKNLMMNIQKEYLEVLKVISKNITFDNIYLFMDEIEQFWKKRKNKVEVIFESIRENNNITFFTAATVLDLSGGDQFPFLLCGEYHVFDDPLFSHLETVDLSLGDYSQLLYEKAIITINDNISIIENHSNLIWVIPIRLLYFEIDKNELKENVENLFVSLFNGIKDIEDYFTKCKTIDDIDKYFNPYFIKVIQLTKNEKTSLTLKEKFGLLKKEVIIQKLNAMNDGLLFYMTLGGLIGQAFELIYTSVASMLIPFIRYAPSYHMVMLIMSNLKSLDKYFVEMESKITRYYIVQIFFNKDDFIGIDLNSYNESINKLDLRKKFNSVKVNIDEKGSFDKIRIQIEHLLEILKEELFPKNN